MKPYPNEELDRMSKREIIRLYKRTVGQFNDEMPVRHGRWIDIDSETYTWKIRCDKCGHERSMLSTQGKYPKFCEGCGAMMEVEHDKES